MHCTYTTIDVMRESWLAVDDGAGVGAWPGPVWEEWECEHGQQDDDTQDDDA